MIWIDQQPQLDRALDRVAESRVVAVDAEAAVRRHRRHLILLLRLEQGNDVDRAAGHVAAEPRRAGDRAGKEVLDAEARQEVGNGADGAGVGRRNGKRCQAEEILQLLS